MRFKVGSLVRLYGHDDNNVMAGRLGRVTVVSKVGSDRLSVVMLHSNWNLHQEIFILPENMSHACEQCHAVGKLWLCSSCQVTG